jgi:putative membrane protein
VIVGERPSGLRLFLTMKGSILSRIWKSLLVTTLLSILVTYTHGDLMHHKITVTTIPFTLMGLPLAIFLGFRNSAAYDRYWEGRKLWGELVLKSRNLARQCLSLIDPPESFAGGSRLGDERMRIVYRTIAYAHALRHQLRDTDGTAELRTLMPEAEWSGLDKASNKPHYIMLQTGADLRSCIKARRVDPCLAAGIDDTLSTMAGAGAACERIKNTPIPFSYTLLLHRTAYLYCFLLPFGLVDSIGFMTPVVVAIVAYTFFGLDALGDEIEEPFGMSANDLALDAICRTIEINLRESVGDEQVPAPYVAVDHCLT